MYFLKFLLYRARYENDPYRPTLIYSDILQGSAKTEKNTQLYCSMFQPQEATVTLRKTALNSNYSADSPKVLALIN